MKRENLESKEFGLIIASRNFPFYAAPEADAVMDGLEERIKELEAENERLKAENEKLIRWKKPTTTLKRISNNEHLDAGSAKDLV